VRWRALTGFALLATWLAFLAALATGDNVCFDPATGFSGIDALGHCASHRPLGLPLTVADDLPLASFVVVPISLALLWWPWRPRRSRGAKTRRDAGAS
jgi:hypothetical protein